MAKTPVTKGTFEKLAKAKSAATANAMVLPREAVAGQTYPKKPITKADLEKFSENQAKGLFYIADEIYPQYKCTAGPNDEGARVITLPADPAKMRFQPQVLRFATFEPVGDAFELEEA